MTQVKIKFIKNETTWDKIITDLDDNIISEELGLMLDENNNKEYFDNWENQLRNIPIFEVVEIERFL
jgi:hypothetical protein